MTEQALNDIAFYGSIIGPLVLMMIISVCREFRTIAMDEQAKVIEPRRNVRGCHPF